MRTTTNRTPRTRKAILAGAATLGAAAAFVAGASPSQAYYINELAPSMISPWYYSQSWALTGYGYLTAPTHVGYWNGYLISDEYAVDMTPVGLGACGQPIYPGWDGMTVYSISSGTGGVYLRKTINGQLYEEKLLHMTGIRVGVGQTVGTNTVVGYSGATGTGSCHLHLAMHKIVNGTRYAVRPVVCGREITQRGVGYRGC